MKAFLVLAFLTIAATANKQQWESFKLTHSKQYSNPIEEKLRYEIFRNNLRKIQEHNAKYEKGESSYFMAVNEFADWTPEQFAAKISTNYLSQPTAKSNFHETAPNFVAPDRIDWREKGAVLEVQHQLGCLSCWAFSATGALEGQNAIHNNVTQLLSNQQLVDCSTKNKRCMGGLPSVAFNFVKHHGICSDESYPYVAESSECRNCSQIIPPIKGYKNVKQDEDSLRDAVAEVGPISILIDMTGTEFYKGGIFDDDKCSEDESRKNHAVLAVGYQDNYWIIKNSFGKTWGEDGYMRLIRGKNKCGVANVGTYPQL